MDAKDVEAFITAKEEQGWANFFISGMSWPTLGMMIMAAADMNSRYLLPLIMLSYAFAMWAHAPSRFVKVPRAELIAIIERQINRDPEALTHLSNKREPGKHLA